MAKRAPVDERPYRPLLDPNVISAALEKASTADPSIGAEEEQAPSAPVKVIDIRRPDRPAKRSAPQEQPVLQSPRVAEGEGSAPALAQQFVDKFDQEKRMLLTRGESMALDRLVGALAVRFNARVKLTHVLRALVALLLHAEDELDKRAGEVVGLIRPPNGDAKALQRFEREIARVLAAAIRDAGPVR